jgi:hydroxylamine dehydrogenase
MTFRSLLLLAGSFSVTIALPSSAQFISQQPDGPQMSDETRACIDCHEAFQPGIVGDWKESRHAESSPALALERTVVERRVSSDSIPANLKNVVVGCYECHSQNAGSHKDNFDHFGYRINVVVTPNDCKTCHAVEANQYALGKKAHAVDNLEKNPVFHLLVEQTIGRLDVKKDKLAHSKPSASTENSTCFACHGTKVEVIGTKQLSTDQGDIEIPVLSNWPNHGVGRINPDGSRGACTACHPRHSFSIETARKPYTCAQCHLQPDVPAWDVYAESKHGNIMMSKESDYDWNAVPWIPGKHLRAPSCATCHNSLLTSNDNTVLVDRTHDFGARLWVRLFGLPYATAQPKSGATHTIKNKEGQPLPVTFGGEPAKSYLIDEKEQSTRRKTMTAVCRTCHGTDLVNNHFANLDTAVTESNKMTATTTALMSAAWKAKQADPSNPFDEYLEREWVESWLFYANSIRYAAAMSGPDYATFKYGWWELTKRIREMNEKKGKR